MSDAFRISRAWAAAKQRAAENGVQIEQVVCALLEGYVDGLYVLPATDAQPEVQPGD